jgi:hypothetical protein
VLVWIGFIATTAVPDYIFAGRPPKHFAINTASIPGSGSLDDE